MRNPAIKALRNEIAKKGVTLKEAIKLLSAKGITLKKVDGEYQVNYKGGKEATTYYTDDLDDAVATGVYMSENKGV